jgi:hypothetical protein
VPLVFIVTLKFDIFLIIISLPLILLVIAGNEIVPAAALVYITYLSSVAETVYEAVLTILNAALGLKFHVAFPLASEIKILFAPAPVGMVTVLLNVVAPALKLVSVDVPALMLMLMKFLLQLQLLEK